MRERRPPRVVHAEVPRRVRRLVVPSVPRRELLREHGDDVFARVSRLDVADEVEGVRDDESGAVAGEDVVAGRRRTIEEVGVGVGVGGRGRARSGDRHRSEIRGGRRAEMRGRLPPRRCVTARRSWSRGTPDTPRRSPRAPATRRTCTAASSGSNPPRPAPPVRREACRRTGRIGGGTSRRLARGAGARRVCRRGRAPRAASDRPRPSRPSGQSRE